MYTDVQKMIGQEWCKPSSYNESDGKPYAGFVAIKSNFGWLILCNVVQSMKTGEVSRAPVKQDEIIQL